VADPTFGIAAQVTPARLTTIMSDEMKSARKVLFIDSGNVLITTDAGQIGELALRDKRAPALAQTPVPVVPHQAGRDSDY
jgi:hypothetical protein